MGILKSQLVKLNRLYSYRILLLLLVGVVLLSAVLVPLRNSSAAGVISVSPLTWNVIGLDSNNVSVGPNRFPVGVRACYSGGGTGDFPVTLSSKFNWGSGGTGASYIALTTGDADYSLTITENGCKDFYYDISVVRTKAAYNTTRPFTITVTAKDNNNVTNSATTPARRELYVEKLVSQNRNATKKIEYYLAGQSPSTVLAGGSLNLAVGNTYTIKLYASTATGGYNQLESFLTMGNSIFRINSVSTTYTAYPASVGPTISQLYADSCGWEPDTASANYLSCVQDDDKSGNEMVVTYNLTIMGGGGTTLGMNSLIYDFSGSSFHYNSDFSTNSFGINITSPVTFSKAFETNPVSVNGQTNLKFTITNPQAAAVSNLSFTDTLPASPGQMKVDLSNGQTVSFSTDCLSPSGSPGNNATSLGIIIGRIPAGGTCTITVPVSANAGGAYQNTTGNLVTNGVDTGLKASAPLNVIAPISPPATCTIDTGSPLALWEFTDNTKANTPPPNSLQTGLTSYNAYLNPEVGSSSVGLIAKYGATRTGSSGYSFGSNGGTDGTAATLDTAKGEYIDFTVDTNGMKQVQFDFYGQTTQNGPVNYTLYHFAYTSQGQALPGSLTADVSGGTLTTTWTLFSKTINSGINDTGATTFRIYFYNSKNASSGADFNLDDVKVSGCGTPKVPTIAKSFTSPAALQAGSTTQLKFTLSNSNGIALTGAAFSDAFPSGLTVANTTIPTNACGGSFSPVLSVGATSVSYSGGTIPANSSCDVVINVLASTAGVFTNTTGYISSTESGSNTGSGGSASANLTVYARPTIVKEFSPSPIYAGASSTLTFSLSNPNNVSITGTAFSDPLPSGVVVAPLPKASTTCGGTVTWSPVSGATSLSFSGGTIPAGSSCLVKVDVTSAAANTYANTSSVLSGSIGTISLTSANPATDDLVVKSPAPGINLLKQVSLSPDGPWAGYLTVQNPTSPQKTVYYRLTVENVGDVDLSGVTVSDPLVDLSACTLSKPFNLPVSSPLASCIVGPFDAQLGDHINTATAAGSYNGSSYTQTSTAEYLGVTLSGSTHLTFTKSVALSPDGPWAEQITGVAPGAQVYYKFIVVNDGSSTVSGITISDPALGSHITTCALASSLAPGAATSCVVDLTNPILSVGGTISTNTASVSYTGGSTNSNTAVYPSGYSSIQGTVWVDANINGAIENSEARLAAVIVGLYYDEDSDGVIDPNELLLGTVPTDSSGAYLFDFIPNSKSYIVKVLSGTIGYEYVSGPAFPGTEISLKNLAANSVGNDFGYQTVPTPDLVISKVNNTNSFATVGVPFSWTIKVSNIGTAAASFTSGQKILTDPLPNSLSYGTPVGSLGFGSSGTFACDIASFVLTCSATSAVEIPAGGTLTVTLDATPISIGKISNQARVDPDNQVKNEISETNNYSALDQVEVTTYKPDLVVIKTNSTTGAGIQNVPFTWTVTVQNIGFGSALFNNGWTILSDTLPVGPTYSNVTMDASATNVINYSNVSCGISSGKLECTASGNSVTLAPGSSFSVHVTVTPQSTTTLTNTASVDPGSKIEETNETNNSGSDTVTVVTAPSLTLAKTNNVSVLQVGGSATYVLTVSNSGMSATSGTITVVDVLPNGMSFGSPFQLGGAQAANWSCGSSGQVLTCTSSTSIASGASSVFSFPVTVSGSASGNLTNRAQVGGGGDPQAGTPNATSAGSCTGNAAPGKGCATDSDPVAVPELTLAKSASPASIAKGGTVTFTMVVSNSGQAATSGTVTVLDVLPLGLSITDGSLTLGGTQALSWSCTASSNVVTCTSSNPIAATNGTSSFTFQATATASADKVLVNRAQVGGGGDPVATTPTNTSAAQCAGSATPVQGCAVANVTVPADLTVTKANDALTPACINTLFNWTLTVSNAATAGTASFGSGDVILSDSLPASGLSYGSLTVTTGTPAPIGTITCAVSGTTLTCSAGSGGVTIAAGASFAVKVPTTPSATGTYSNTAEVDPGNRVTESNETNNTGSNSLTIKAPHLTLAKSATPSTVSPGGSLSYTFTVSNSGDAATSGTVTVVDVLPANIMVSDGTLTLGGADKAAWSCTAASNVISCTSSIAITAGGTSTFSFLASVGESADGTLVNQARVGGGGDPGATTPTETNTKACTDAGTPPQGCATNSVSVLPELTISKSHTPSGQVYIGQTFQWVVTVQNDSGAGTASFPAGSLILSDTLPSGPTYGTPSLTKGGAVGTITCALDEVSRVLSCSAGSGGVTLAPGASLSVSVDVTPQSAATLSNTASVDPASNVSESNENDNSASDSATVISRPDLTVDKTNNASGKVNVGEFFKWTITVANTGSAATFAKDDVIVSDTLPADLSYPTTPVLLTVNGKTDPTGTITCAIDESSKTLTCTAGTGGVIMPAGSAFAVRWDAEAPVTITKNPTSYSNTASVDPGSKVTESNEANNTGTDSVSVSQSTYPDLTIEKTNSVNNGPIDSSTGKFSWSITIYNSGNSALFAADAVILTDSLPTSANYGTLAKDAYGTLSASAIQCAITAGTLSCLPASGPVTMAAGDWFKVTIPVTGPAAANYDSSLANTATVDPGNMVKECDGTPCSEENNNSSSSTVTTGTLIDLSIIKTNSDTTVPAGGTTSYTLTVANAGPNTAVGTLLQDPAATGITQKTVTCQASGTAVCPTGPLSLSDLEGAGISIPSIPAGSSVTFTVTAEISASATSVTNTATIIPPAGTTDKSDTDNSSSDTDTVTPVADLGVLKTDGDGNTQAQNGETLTYTLRVTNYGPSSVTGAVLKDPSAAGLSKLGVVCSSAAANQCSEALTPTIAQLQSGAGYALPVLAKDAFYEINITAVVTASSGSVSNSASVANPAGTTDPCTSVSCDHPNSGTDTDTILVPSDLAVAKTNNAASPLIKDATFTWTLSVSNAEGAGAAVFSAGDTILEDTLPTGVSYVNTPSDTLSVSEAQTGMTCAFSGKKLTCSAGEGGVTLPAATSFTVSYQVKADQVGAWTNTVSVDPGKKLTESSLTNNSDSDPINIYDHPAISKAFSPATISVGGTSTITFTLSNPNAYPMVEATFSDTLTDMKVSSTQNAGGTCTGASSNALTADATSLSLTGLTIPAGSSCTVTVPVTSTVLGDHPNTAGGITAKLSKDGSTIQLPKGDDSTPATLTVTPLADIKIVKVASNATPVMGDTITFTLTVTNDGPSDATGVYVLETLPSGYTYISDTPSKGTYDLTSGKWTIGSLANGASVSLTLSVTVESTGGYSNCASVTGDQTDPDTSDNTDTESTTPQPKADLGITKMVNLPAPYANSNVVFTLQVTNYGPNAASGITVTDILPSGYTYVSDNGSGAYVSSTGTWTIGTLANGASVSLNITATVLATGEHKNTASVSGSTYDPTPGNNSAEKNTSPATPSISLAKTGTLNKAVKGLANVVDAGDTISYSFSVTNTGNVALTGISVSDPSLPSLSCTISTLAVGDTKTCTATNNVHTITQAQIDAGTYTNTATASVTPPAGPTINSTDDDTQGFPPAPSLALVKTASPTSYSATGDPIDYSYTIRNSGNVTLSGPFTITDDKIGTITCSQASLAPGATVTCGAVYTVTASDVTAGSVTNTASAKDGNSGTTSDPFSATVGRILITKQVSDSPDGPWSASITGLQAGDPVYYLVTVKSQSVSALEGITVSDPKCTLKGPKGDDNVNLKLESSETWIYTCVITAVEGTQPNTVTLASNTFSGVKASASYSASLAPTAVPTAVPQPTPIPSGPGSVIGRIYHDANSNGVRDATEEVIQLSVTVDLVDVDGKVIKSVTTTNGVFEFTDIPAGNYRVIQHNDPAGYASTTSNDLSVQVKAGETAEADFGEYQIPPGLFDLKGYVWYDKDEDTLKEDDEPGIPGIELWLIDHDGNHIATTTSDANGLYTFTGLTAGVYSVIEFDQVPYAFSTTINYKWVMVGPESVAQVQPAILPVVYQLQGPVHALNYVDNPYTGLSFGDFAPPSGCTFSADPLVDTRSGSYPGTVKPGDPYFMNFQVGNNGNLPAGNVTVSTQLPGYLEITAVNLTYKSIDGTGTAKSYTVTQTGNLISIVFSEVDANDVYNVAISSRVAGDPGLLKDTLTVHLDSYTTLKGDNKCADTPGNNDGKIDLEVLGSTGGTTLHPTSLPNTGFVPGQASTLPEKPQGVEIALAQDPRIRIPAIGLDAPVLGITGSSGWDVTWLGDRVGWLEGTAYMGGTGNSVLVGHNYLATGAEGPLLRLASLKEGDVISIEQGRQRVEYVVGLVTVIGPDDPLGLQHESGSWLTLVTCKDYDPATKAYLHRVIARAYLRIVGTSN